MATQSIALALAALSAMPVAAGAVESGMVLQLGTSGGDFERRVVRYDCGSDAPLEVSYINAAPNFLAIVPVEGEAEPLIFSAVLSGSGARYAASQWVWVTKGPEATLIDATLDDDADAVLTCSEVNNTP